MQSSGLTQAPFTIVPPGASKLGDYEVTDIISKAEYGIVYRGICKSIDPPLPVAIKTMFFSKMPSEMQEIAIKECSLNQTLQHPNLLQCYDIFMENDELHMILELAGGDLQMAIQDLRAQGEYFTEKDIWKMLYFLSQALAYIHSCGIVHRDVRPSNLLLTSSGQLKLADLGMGLSASSSNVANDTQMSSKSSYSLRHSGINAVHYHTPPEIILGQQWSPSSDVWCAGVVLYELCTLHLPFIGAKSGDLLSVADQIINGAIDHDLLRNSVSQELYTLITAMLSPDASLRPDAQSVVLNAKRTLLERKNNPNTSGTGSSSSSLSSSSSIPSSASMASLLPNITSTTNTIVLTPSQIHTHNPASSSSSTTSTSTSTTGASSSTPTGNTVPQTSIIRCNARGENPNQHAPKWIDLSTVVLKERLGSGSRSTVWKATAKDRDNLEHVIAVKEVQGDPRVLDQVEQEVDLLCGLSEQKYIVYCYGSIRRWNSIWIVLEYCNRHDLSHIIENCKEHGIYLPEIILWYILRQIAGALKYTHKLRIVHRDIKPPNVLLTQDYHVKLADLGVSRQLSADTEQAYTVVGTPCYMAPEAIASKGVTASSDIWGLGCVMHELASLEPAFSQTNSLFKLSTDISTGIVPLLSELVPKDVDTFPIRFSSSSRNSANSTSTTSASAQTDAMAANLQRRKEFFDIFHTEAPIEPIYPSNGRSFMIKAPPFTDPFIPPSQFIKPPFDPNTFLERYGSGLYSARLTWLISAMMAKSPADRPESEYIYNCSVQALQLWGPDYVKAALKSLARAFTSRQRANTNSTSSVPMGTPSSSSLPDTTSSSSASSSSAVPHAHHNSHSHNHHNHQHNHNQQHGHMGYESRPGHRTRQRNEDILDLYTRPGSTGSKYTSHTTTQGTSRDLSRFIPMAGGRNTASRSTRNTSSGGGTGTSTTSTNITNSISNNNPNNNNTTTNSGISMSNSSISSTSSTTMHDSTGLISNINMRAYLHSNDNSSMILGKSGKNIAYASDTSTSNTGTGSSTSVGGGGGTSGNTSNTSMMMTNTKAKASSMNTIPMYNNHEHRIGQKRSDQMSRK